jgi:phosphopantetheine adenylyltransferase
VIDWLRTLCKRVDTQFLLLEEEDREITDTRVRSIMQNLSRPQAPASTLW